jgi:hypothetical protein
MRARMICLGAVFAALTLGAAIPQLGDPSGSASEGDPVRHSLLLASCVPSTRQKLGTSQSTVGITKCDYAALTDGPGLIRQSKVIDCPI